MTSYVYLTGDIISIESLTFVGASPQFTLNCISTGGPATNVTWTRDFTTVITEGTETVLNDPVTAQYTHTLNVTTAGVYTCTVANDKPSSASSSFTVTGMIEIPCLVYYCTMVRNLRILIEKTKCFSTNPIIQY